MQTTPTKIDPRNPVEIAREAFRMLAMRRVAPTPDAYRTAYLEISGRAEELNAEGVLSQFAVQLSRGGETADSGQRLKRAMQSSDWRECIRTLSQLTEKRFSAKTASTTSIHISNDADEANLLRELLSRTLGIALAALVEGAPELLAETEELARAVKEARTEDDLVKVASRLKQLCYRIEARSGELSEQQEMMRRLLALLLENISELVEDDSWLCGQIEVVRTLIAGPMDVAMLENATQNLKQIIYKQSTVKHSLKEAKVTLKNMMMTFIDRLGSVAAKTSDYNEKMSVHVKKISQATSIVGLSDILADVMRETQNMQMETMRAQEAMVLAQQEVQNAETRIHRLESELDQMSEKLRQDQLTGSLNRRGLNDAFEREAARADRTGQPLCIGMLDIDNFKNVNDTHGHAVGDVALVHLVDIIKLALRPTDDVARYGGEEFLILLPDTTIPNGIEVLTRVQRELTKRFFLADEQRLFITFSAGITLRLPKEEQEEVIRRADEAMYQAKHEGKNRVIAVTPTQSTLQATHQDLRTAQSS